MPRQAGALKKAGRFLFVSSKVSAAKVLQTNVRLRNHPQPDAFPVGEARKNQ
jgi:hypothetical protein